MNNFVRYIIIRNKRNILFLLSAMLMSTMSTMVFTMDEDDKVAIGGAGTGLSTVELLPGVVLNIVGGGIVGAGLSPLAAVPAPTGAGSGTVEAFAGGSGGEEDASSAPMAARRFGKRRSNSHGDLERLVTSGVVSPGLKLEPLARAKPKKGSWWKSALRWVVPVVVVAVPAVLACRKVGEDQAWIKCFGRTVPAGIAVLGAGVVGKTWWNKWRLKQIENGLNEAPWFSDSYLRDAKLMNWKARVASGDGADVTTPAWVIANWRDVVGELSASLTGGKFFDIDSFEEHDGRIKDLWWRLQELANDEVNYLKSVLTELSSMTNVDEVLRPLKRIRLSSMDSDFLRDRMDRVVLAKRSAQAKSCATTRTVNFRHDGRTEFVSGWRSKRPGMGTDVRVFGVNFNWATELYVEVLKRYFYVQALQSCISAHYQSILGEVRIHAGVGPDEFERRRGARAATMVPLGAHRGGEGKRGE